MSQAAATALVLSTGPRTAEGKAASSRNATTHGLTSKSPLLPSEDPKEFEAFRDAAQARFAPEAVDDVAAVAEYIDITWRLRRIPAHESRLIAVELKRMRIARKTDRDLDELLDGLDETALEAVAYERLLQSKTFVNLHRQEANLNRRLARLEKVLVRLLHVQSGRRIGVLQREEFAEEFAKVNDPGYDGPAVRLPRMLYRL